MPYSVSSTAKADEALLQRCQRIEAKAPKDFEESLLLNDKLLDSHEECRTRLDKLIEFERKKK